MGQDVKEAGLSFIEELQETIPHSDGGEPAHIATEKQSQQQRGLTIKPSQSGFGARSISTSFSKKLQSECHS